MVHKAKSSGFCGLCIAAAIWAASPMFSSTARGESTVLTSNNSSLTINYSPVSPEPFITNWTVDGINQYGGSPAGSEDFQISTGGGPLVELNSMSTSPTSPPPPGVFSALYTGTGFTVSVDETLLGGLSGSGASDLGEEVVINNTGASPLAFKLLQIVNLTLDATAGNNTLTLFPSPATQSFLAIQKSPVNEVQVSMGTVPPYTFTYTGGTVGSQSVSTGPFVGNCEFTVQWGGTIPVDGSFLLSNDWVLGPVAAVPLPNAASSALATLAGLAGIGIVRRMRRTVA